MVTYGDNSFLLFLWERFKTLGPKPTEFEDEHGNVPDKPFKMGAHLCFCLKQHKHKRLSKFIDSEQHFNFRMYTFSPRGILEAKLSVALGGGRVEVFSNEVPINILMCMEIIPALLPFITVSKTWAIS